MDLLAFIHVVDPTKVKVVERERSEGEVKLLDSTVRRVVSLLPVAPACAESELEASVNKLFDEGGSADQGNSATGDTTAVAAERPKQHRKKRPSVADASGSSHPPIKLMRDHVASCEVAMGGNYGDPAFLTPYVSTTLEREDDNPMDSVTVVNLRAIGLAKRFVISLDFSHHSSTHASEAEVDSVIRSAIPLPVITKAVITATTADVASPSHLPGKELSLGSREVDSEHIHEAFIPRWNISNDALLDDLDTSREFVDHLAPPVLISQIRDMDYEQLFTEFNVVTARQVCLNAKVRMRTEYCLSKRKRLELECVNQANLLKAKDDEVKSLNAQLLLKEAEAVETIHLCYQDLELKDLNATWSFLQSLNDGIVDQVCIPGLIGLAY
nr:hypothetical protein [Tanacetum cinerariifolium]